MNEQNKSQLTQVKIYSMNSTELYELTDKEMTVIKTVCPTKTDWESYKNLIPNEVEENIKLLKQLFWKVYVYENKELGDPFAVGVLKTETFARKNIADKDGNTVLTPYKSIPMSQANQLIVDGVAKEDDFCDYEQNIDRKFLLTQWGRELKPLVELTRIAKQLWTAREKRQLTEQKLDAEKKLAMLDMDAEAMFGVVGGY